MALEPPPPPAQEWSQWDITPTLPPSWPGLGEPHEDGFTVGHGTLSGIAVGIAGLVGGAWQNIVGQAFHGLSFFDNVWESALGSPNLDQLLQRFSDIQGTLGTFLDSVGSEIATAAILVAQGGEAYRLSDFPPGKEDEDFRTPYGMGNAPAAIRQKVPAGLRPGGGYPQATETFEPLTDKGDPPGYLDVSAVLELHALTAFGQYAVSCRDKADKLVEVTHHLRSRANDLSDAPWRGPAAEAAQESLRRIYANVRLGGGIRQGEHGRGPRRSGLAASQAPPRRCRRSPPRLVGRTLERRRPQLPGSRLPARDRERTAGDLRQVCARECHAGPAGPHPR
ncbi:hypothetical protein ACGF0J_19320 [Nonomuraea sp. NPDC047897]|uniref:hypothetical protein n=1 Tax=Nonomuraea sp. NPDC047897 TaxID=3364346 RepID=UPI00371C139F